MAETDQSARQLDTHQSIDLVLHRIKELEDRVDELAGLEKTVDRLQDRWKLVVAIVLFVTPLLWKIIDKIWP